MCPGASVDARSDIGGKIKSYLSEDTIPGFTAKQPLRRCIMIRLPTLALMSLFIAPALLAPAQLQAKEVCIPIHTRAVGAFTGPTTTASAITGGGILHGTTTAELEITGVSGSVLFFEGTITFFTNSGALTLDLVGGIFDTATGEFNSDSVVTSGTGRFVGASGSLFFHGFSFPDGTFITEEISGTICVIMP